ncbi:hypothetical protein Q1695_006009 [Nippostrongylus brasiliensis]|nr:hypothetical protein Q1695_006009 [Nippostrongylus brasiliensis]
MPVTRGGAQSTPASLSSNSDVSETDVSQQYSVNIDSLIAPLSGSLSTLDDNAVVHGREAKVLRDATSAAISQVWNDARSQTSSLASSINESTLALSRRLNDSFSAVGDRLESTPMVATLGADGSLPGVRSFSGTHALVPDTDVPTRTSALTVEESVITVASAPGQLIGRHAMDGCKVRVFNPVHFLPTVVLLRVQMILVSCRVLLPPTHNVDLESAQQRIVELSLAVDQTKAQLQQSEARVAAFMARNEELSQTTFGQRKPSSSASIPDVRTLFLCSLAIICFSGFPSEY